MNNGTLAAQRLEAYTVLKEQGLEEEARHLLTRTPEQNETYYDEDEENAIRIFPFNDGSAMVEDFNGDFHLFTSIDVARVYVNSFNEIGDPEPTWDIVGRLQYAYGILEKAAVKTDFWRLTKVELEQLLDLRKHFVTDANHLADKVEDRLNELRFQEKEANAIDRTEVRISAVSLVNGIEAFTLVVNIPGKVPVLLGELRRLGNNPYVFHEPEEDLNSWYDTKDLQGREWLFMEKAISDIHEHLNLNQEKTQ